MARICIIEGCDGSGKTTLANWLVKEHGFLYYHLGPPKPGEDLLTAYTRVLLTAKHSKRDVVIDRLYLGEAIYGPIMRGKDTLGRHGRTLIERLCHSLGARLVICLPRLDICMKNWDAKQNDYVDTEDKFMRVYEAYEAEAKGNYLPYDYTDPHEAIHRHWMLDEAKTPLPDGVIGNPAAEFLIVGEQVNAKRAIANLPFYSLEHSSLYLLEALSVSRLREENLAFTNAVRPGGKVADKHRHRRKSTKDFNLLQVARSLPYFERAIALGDTAARVCAKQGVPFKKVPHPSFWKRFKYNDLKGYATLLEEAAQ